MTVPTIRPQALAELCQRGEKIDLIDVRTPVEYREVHSSYARNIPLTELQPTALLTERGSQSEAPLYFICKSGGRGRQACERFLAAGFTHVVNVEGGTTAWEAAGLPVRRGKKAMALERQVRIVAGLLVLLGTGLGLSVSPYFFGLAAFVGAGLIFAGLTDTCGMALLLARMPWNQVQSTTCATRSATTCATPTQTQSAPMDGNAAKA
ncbi:MAG: rhodanese-like domain-containing protein [Bacteroidales bacterium]|nr:rhodanese-like domain-containing protein [Bacteroidales bacterium]